MQARYYDPAIGRFLSVDPVGFVESGYDPRYFNRYSYAGNKPISNNDPNAEVINFVAGAFIGAAVDLAFQAVNVANGGEFNTAQFAASVGAGALTSGGSAIIAATSLKVGTKIAATSVLGGTSNTLATVGANSANGQETSVKQAASSFVAGAVGAGLGSSSAASASNKITTSSAIQDSIRQTTASAGSVVSKSAAGKAASRAALGQAISSHTQGAALEAGAKVLDSTLNKLDE